MKLFHGRNLIEFTERFQSDLDCKNYLAHFKWSNGYNCKKCNNPTSQIRADYSRTCNKCSHTESPTAGTLFHKVKFGLKKAFFICFEMSTSTQSLSANYVATRFSISPQAARLFMHKVREAMKSSEKNPMKGKVQVDEFVIGGKEEGVVGRSYHTSKKKIVCALELGDNDTVKRMYAIKIENYSAKELKRIFDKHIDKQAPVETDEWKGYKPLMSLYNIKQKKSEQGANFPILHTMIHKIKSWIRNTYSSVSDFNIDRYLSEFCYRLNRSQSKATVFNNLIQRMLSSSKVTQNDLICS